MNNNLPNITISDAADLIEKWFSHAMCSVLLIILFTPTTSFATTCTTTTSNITFNGLDKNLIYSATGQDFPSKISYLGANGTNVWSINVKGSSADFDPKIRDTRTTNGSGAPWENPMWANANGVWFNGIYPNELIDFEFNFTRVSGSDPLEFFVHNAESLDDEIDTLITTGDNWVLGRNGNMTSAPNVSGKTAIFEDNGLALSNSAGNGYWEISSSFSGNSGVVTWNYDYIDSDPSYKGTNMIAFEVIESCSTTATDLSCSTGYQLETWPAAAPSSTVFDSTNNLLRLTASTNFTNSTHPGIGGIITSASNGEVSESLILSFNDPTVSDVESFRILVYDLDSETVNDQDYAYITTGGVNLAATSVGSNVEKHPSITNAYRAILASGGGSGADDPYHAGFIDIGIADNTTYALSSGYTGTGSESFVGYQACVAITPPATSKCFAMTDNVAELYSFDLDISTAPTKINTTMILNGEGAAYRASDDSIYTFHQPIEGDTDPTDLYRVDMDGTVTLVKASFLSSEGVGVEFVRYTDGTERLIVLQRGSGSKLLVFDAQDLTNSTPLSILPLLLPSVPEADVKIAGLAVNPLTGEILVVDDANDSGDLVEIYSVNTDTGQLTLKTTLAVAGIDAESLAFAEDGELYTENDKDKSTPAYRNKIYRIDLSTGNLTAVEENIDTVVSGDIEGMSCTGSKIITTNSSSTANISGTIFEDINYGGGAGRDYTTANTSYASATVGTEATVELWYSDGTQCLPQPNGSKPPKNEPIQTTTSSAFDGSYSFNNVTGNNFCVRVVNSSVLSNLSLINGSNTTIPVQTYRTQSVDGSGTISAISNEVGGRSPLDADVAANIFDSVGGDGSIAQSWSVVNISGGDVSGIDFGFNFNTIVNTNDADQGSLRQFIINANTFGDETNLAQSGQTAGREVSIFMLPNGTSYSGILASAGNVFSAGVATIDLQSELPAIVRSYVDIDATTQINASCPTPILELNGASAGTNTDQSSQLQGTSGLTIRRADHMIRGLIINRFASSGIELARTGYPSASDSSENTHIGCSWIGLDRTGTSAQANGELGVALWGMNSYVGNGTSAGRNVISGNTLDGIMNGGGGSLDNTIRGNYIGTDSSGTGAVGNGRHGIQYYNTNGTSAGNISLIEGNTIAYNGLSGVGIARTTPKATHVRIKQNSIFNNAEIGIDLVSSGVGAITQGVTLNDIGDVDTSSRANGLQNFPVISSALRKGSDIEISGTLNSLASRTFDVEIYSNQVCNADQAGVASTDDYGEGEKYHSTLQVTTGGTGDGSFSLTLPDSALAGNFLTALAANITAGDSELVIPRSLVNAWK